MNKINIGDKFICVEDKPLHKGCDICCFNNPKLKYCPFLSFFHCDCEINETHKDFHFEKVEK